MWIFLGAVAFFTMIIVVVALYLRDRRYEKKSVAETMGKEVWDDISKEREDSLARARKFKEELKKARRSDF